MKNITTMLQSGNLTAKERFVLLAQNDIHRMKTGKEILTKADVHTLEHWKAKDSSEAHEWNTMNEGWMLSGRMGLEIELLFKDAQISYASNLPFDLALSSYPIDHRMRGAIQTLKDIKKVTIDEATTIVNKQKEAKLREGMDFSYVVYRLAFELLSPKDKKRMHELYDDVETDHQYLDQEEEIANLLDGNGNLSHDAKEKLAALIADKSYNAYAKEYQLFHYFACIPLLEIAKHFLQGKGIAIPEIKDDGLRESDAVKELMEQYASKHTTTVREMLYQSALSALDAGLLDDHTPLAMSTDAELFARWLKTKDEARTILTKHVNDGKLSVRKRTDSETFKQKLYSKGQYDKDLVVTREVIEGMGFETPAVGEMDEKTAFEVFDDTVITGESLYAFTEDYIFVKRFKEQVDTYDPNLGLVYADDDPKHEGAHLDQELLVCDFDAANGAHFFSRYGMSVTLINNIHESQAIFKEMREGGTTYLVFTHPAYEQVYTDRRKNLADTYAQLRAFEAIFKKLDVIYEAEMSFHVSHKVTILREFIEKGNDAIRTATNTQKEEVEGRRADLFRRKEKLHLKEDWIIDVDALKPDRSLVQEHALKLREIFREEF